MGLSTEVTPPFSLTNAGMTFKGFQKVSLLEYPGKISAVVWVGGCNFRCPFCYNREIVLNPTNVRSISEEEVLEHLRSKSGWLDGIVVTGGEPTIHQTLPAFFEKVKELGHCVKLDTNGSNPKMLKELIEGHLVDYIALDVKAPLIEAKYQAVAGTPGRGVIEEIEGSIELLLTGEIDYEFRTTVVPTLLSAEDVVLIAERIKGAKRYFLQQFKPTNSHVDENYSKLTPYPLELLERIKRRVANYFGTCGVRGAR